MTKGKEQNSYAAQANCDGRPVQLFDQVVASSTLSDGFFAVLVGKDKSNARFGSRGVARGDNLSSFQASTSVVRGMVFSGVESVSSWSSPSRESGFFDKDGERVFGYKVISGEPTNLDGSEWVMNLDSLLGEDNLWVDYKNPEDGHGSQAVDDSDVSFSNHVGGVERTCSKTADDNNYSKVSPVTSLSLIHI